MDSRYDVRYRTFVTGHPQASSTPDRLQMVRAGLVVDGTGSPPLKSATLVVRGSRIVEVTGAPIDPPQGAEVIDLPDSVVIPGMIDLHVHLAAPFMPRPTSPVLAMMSSTSPFLALSAAAHAAAMLQSGFTTVRDLSSWGNTFNEEVIAVRDAINSGMMSGPRISAAGWVGQTGGHNVSGAPSAVMRDKSVTADGPWAVRRLVREVRHRGADLVKTSAGGGMGSIREASWWRNYTDEEMSALVEESHAMGMRVAVHAYHPDQIVRAVRAGADTIEHGTYADSSTLATMASNDTWLVPTLSVFSDATYARKVAQAAPLEVLEKFRLTRERVASTMGAALDASVKIGCGTDVYNAGEEFFQRSGEEVFHLVKAGMSPLAALSAATKVSAEALGKDDDVGTLQAGRYADFVVLAADPLQDVGVLCSGSAVQRVYKGGVLVVDNSGTSPGGRTIQNPPNFPKSRTASDSRIDEEQLW